MLSISARNASSSDIRSYLVGERDGAGRSPEDYYTESGHARGQWLGSGAKDLGLAGDVSETAFDRLADGYHPGTDKTIVQGAGSERHRPGWDFTFSAPKSVSIVWGVSDPKHRVEIEQAHRLAIERTFEFAERSELFITRRGKGGFEREAARPVIAAYQHGTSREADPQLHTHCFVFNTAARTDGTWGTLETRPLYDWKMALGAVYRAELAEHLRGIGYVIEADAKGVFRLADFPRDLERHFSKRRAQIEAALAQRGTRSARAAELAALDTRNAKTVADVATLRDLWRTQASEKGLSFERMTTMRTLQMQPKRAVDERSLTSALTAQNSSFMRRDIARAVAERVQVAGGGIARIQKLMESVAMHYDVLRLRHGHYTTREMLQIELGVLARATRMSGDGTHSVDQGALEHVTTSRPLSEEQRDAVVHVTGARRIALVEGMAGTGKSHMLGAAREAWEDSGYTVRGAALAGKAAKGLQDSSGISSQTIHSLLANLDAKRERLTDRTVVVIDEAGMVGSRHLDRILKHVDDVGAKAVLVGDARQLQPIDAGQMFATLAHEIGSAKLVDIRRQRHAADRDMVHAFARGDAAAALESLASRGRVHTTPDSHSAMQKMIDDWASQRDPRRPGDDLMLAATRADARTLNNMARDAMRARGSLGHDTPIETNDGPRLFAEGDRLVITRNSPVLNIRNGDLATIVGLRNFRGGYEINAELDNGKKVAWRTSELNHFDHGYAITVHKGQGATVERSYVFAHESMSAREWSYVATSRAREAVHIYTDRFTGNDLGRVMSRSTMKDTSLDHLEPNPKKEYGRGRI